MAKSAKVIVPKKTALVVPSSLRERAVRDAGKGVSTSRDDNIIPIVRLLQPLSPQVRKKGPDSISGAEPGDYWSKDHDPALAKSDEGFLFSISATNNRTVEWRPLPDGGGFVANHDGIPKEAIGTFDDRTGRMVHRMPNGNELVDTRFFYGHILFDSGSEQWAIPFKSTGHTIARRWITSMNARKNPDGSTNPAWMNYWRVKSIERTNAAGTWWVPDFSFESEMSDEAEYQKGSDLHDAIMTGVKDVEADDNPIDIPASNSGGRSAAERSM